ncbi:hypothetical protein KS4_18680 [Poriferisphaera corsica]|uniref:Response regulatory domain-containing protein n=1 Tax=Poriferisphaera corsica TaxID=2528020 RepID=A0A517YUA8_9BACT|nr:hypothetical protein [Poriferisphaera corsica]QDU33810.1 hypothetical protein KS4_18680 [Poriferisphaera corsica]
MIIYICNDLIFGTKISSTAEALGIVSRPVRNLSMLENRLNMVDDGKPNHPVSGMMLDLDTGEDGLKLLDAVKAHSPEIPVVAFGSHVLVDMLESARQRGADFVMPRGAFTANLVDILERMKGEV